MKSKIEAAEALAAAVEEFDRMEDGHFDWSDVADACKAYRSASVPSDDDLGRVAYDAGFGEHGRYRWNKSAAAVREWVQRDGLTEEEREAVIKAVRYVGVGAIVETAELRDSILRKLGHEPEPVWEWDNANAMWTLGGKVNGEVFPCASVSLSKDGGILGRVYYSDTNRDHCVVDSFNEASEWCEQQLREARQ